MAGICIPIILDAKILPSDDSALFVNLLPQSDSDLRKLCEPDEITFADVCN